MRKLVTYWILFSLISLFELAFTKLIERVPIWPYIKLVVICCLVVPRFKRAYSAYKSYVQPCLTLNLEEVINRLNKLQEATPKTEKVLAVVERYVKENGAEALEKLMASKGSTPNFDNKEIKAIANAEGKDMAPTLKVKSVDASLGQTEKKAIATVEVKEMMTPPAGGEKELPVEASLASLVKVQKQWTCAVCQVKTTSETTLNSHLQGSKHKAKCEELKAKAKATKRTAKNKAASSSSSTARQSVEANHDSKKSVPGDVANQNRSTKHEEKVQVTRVEGNSEQVRNLKDKRNGEFGKHNKKYECTICDVSCTSEIDLMCHLKGQKHLSRVQALSWI